MSVAVYKDTQGDWVMECTLHQETHVASDWPLAYEAALGHYCMYHTITVEELLDRADALLNVRV